MVPLVQAVQVVVLRVQAESVETEAVQQLHKQLVEVEVAHLYQQQVMLEHPYHQVPVEVTEAMEAAEQAGV
jgi:putative NADPH-quinone reductase